MNFARFPFLLCLCFFSGIAFSSVSEDHPTLSVGSKAPSFSLKGVDGKTYSLASFSKYKILVIVFTCNHCPTAQAYDCLLYTSDAADERSSVDLGGRRII